MMSAYPTHQGKSGVGVFTLGITIGARTGER
jgi:hypothetical protein